MTVVHNEYIVWPINGLCNRLRVIFSWLQYSIEQQKPLIVLWDNNPECPGMFLDYFKCPQNCTIITDNIKQYKNYTYKGHAQHPSVKINKHTYDTLVLQDRVSNLLNSIIINYGRYNSVHIRRTDLDPILNQANQPYTTDDIFQNFIDQSDYKVYLSTDNADTQIRYKNLFADKILIRNAINPTNELRQTSMLDAVLDAFICINSNKFLGTHYSSFSGFIRTMMSKA